MAPNLIYIDEASYLNLRVFNETVPMLEKSGHMVIVTSHRRQTKEIAARRRKANIPNNAENWLDPLSLKAQGFLVNNVCHVCQEHILAVLGTDLLTCPCNVFQRPYQHVDVKGDQRRLMSAISANSEDAAQTLSSYADMLSEAGIILPNFVFDCSNQVSWNTSNMDVQASLAKFKDSSFLSPTARGNFLANNLDMLSLINDMEVWKEKVMNVYMKHCPDELSDFVRMYKEGDEQQLRAASINLANKPFNIYPPQKLVSRTLIVYIDPAPTRTGSSEHGLSFIAKVSSNSNQFPVKELFGAKVDQEPQLDYYVILAIDEYSTDDAETNFNTMNAVSKIFMILLYSIKKYYNNYFNKLIVIPEANSLSLDEFFISSCEEKYAEVLRGVEVKVTAMENFFKKIRRKKRKFQETLDDEDNQLDTLIQSSEDEFYEDHDFPRSYRRPDRHEMIERERARRGRINAPASKLLADHRIGYALGGEKCNLVLTFFSKFFTTDKRSQKRVICAKHIISKFIYKQLVNTTTNSQSFNYATYICERLNQIRVCTKKSGELTLSGKSQSLKTYICDDLPIALSLSVVLYDRFIREPKFHLKMSTVK